MKKVYLVDLTSEEREELLGLLKGGPGTGQENEPGAHPAAGARGTY